MSVYLEKQYKLNALEDVYNKISTKIIVFVISAQGLVHLNSKGIDKPIKGPVVARVIVGDTKVKTNEITSYNPTFNQLLFLDVSSQDVRTIQFEIKESNRKVISEGRLEIMPTKNQIHNIDIQLKFPAKDKKKNAPSSLDTSILGVLKCRVLITDSQETVFDTVAPPVYPSLVDEHEPFEYFYEPYKRKLKTGDLIAFEEVGIIGAAVNLLTNSNHSRIGMVISKKNKYTGEEMLYVAELTKNSQKYVDSFKEVPIIGLNLFKLWERIHGFSGLRIWWIPLKEELDKDPKENMVEWISTLHSNGFQFDPNLHIITPALVDLFYELGFKDAVEYQEVCSSLLFMQALKMGGRRFQNEKSFPLTDIVNKPIFNEPVLFRAPISN